MSHSLEPEQLLEYERAVNALRLCLCDAIEKGKRDGSINEGTDTQEPYLKKTGIRGSVAGLYFEFYGQQEPKGTIVISHGFTESCEKYHELVHIEDFSVYVEDMHRFIEKEVQPRTQGRPLYLYAHSMGGFDPQEPFEGSGCASYGWAGEAMKAGKKAIAMKNAANIRIPVLLFQAKRDTFVRAKEQEIFSFYEN